MSEKLKNNIVLLPSGFHDVLPPEAAQETKIISKLLRNFEKFGYAQVKAPLMEFETSLISGKGEGLSKETFRVMDPVSREMMGIRADMTMQIARMAAIRLKNKPRPLRLSYSGQVLRVNNKGISAERQLAQAGIELIGDSSPNSDIEAVIVAMDSLKNLKLKGLSVDFSIPALSNLILDEEKTPESKRKNILELIEKKDTSAIKSEGGEAGTLLAALINSAGEAEKSLKKIAELKIPKEGKILLERLKEIILAVRDAMPEIKITIDPLERHGFEYHSGIGFSFFSKMSAEELGRGGRYNIDINGEEAVGFTFSVNALKKALKPAVSKKKIFVPFGVSFNDSTYLREKGLYTIHGLAKVKDIKSEALRLECSFYYDDGEVRAVK